MKKPDAAVTSITKRSVFCASRCPSTVTCAREVGSLVAPGAAVTPAQAALIGAIAAAVATSRSKATHRVISATRQFRRSS
jgi:hypothetical protein